MNEDALPVGTRVGPWRIAGDLGEGGMSCVHAAVHADLGRRVAIKIARHSVTGPAQPASTFLREARIARAIKHPAVIDVIATGSYAGRPYLVLEELAGETLCERVETGPQLHRSVSIRILIGLCDVLRASHAAGVIHRDLKLENIFLCGGKLKLLDWGVAYVMNEPDPFRGLITGTLTYVAPEQIRGDNLTPATDVYSLAVLAYHLLCGRPPFAGSDLTLLTMHLKADPPTPSMAWPDIPIDLELLLLRMLSKVPSERPDIDEVERTLRAALPELEPTRRFADGSRLNFPALMREAPSTWQLRYLLAKRLAPPPPCPDVFGRPLLRLPPLGVSWLCVGVVAVLAGLLGVMP